MLTKHRKEIMYIYTYRKTDQTEGLNEKTQAEILFFYFLFQRIIMVLNLTGFRNVVTLQSSTYK